MREMIFTGSRVHMVSEGRILDWTGLMKLADGAMVVARRRTREKEGRAKSSAEASDSEGKHSGKSSAEEKFVMIDRQQVMKECRRQGWGDGFIDSLVT